LLFCDVGNQILTKTQHRVTFRKFEGLNYTLVEDWKLAISKIS